MNIDWNSVAQTLTAVTHPLLGVTIARLLASLDDPADVRPHDATLGG